MKKIKVVHVVPMLSPGGAERVAVHIVKGLDRQRYEPVVISFRERQGCELDHLLDNASVEVRYLDKHPGFDYRMFSRVYRALKDSRPDVIHTHLHVLRYALPSMLLLHHASHLHTVHNLAEREIEPRGRWIQRYAFSRGVVPVAVAQEVAHSVERLYEIPRCQVIPNGIPTSHYACPRIPRAQWRERQGFDNEDVLFACVARFAPQKNHALLIKAFAEGPALDPNAHLVLVGDGVLKEQLLQQISRLGLDRQVHLLGLRADIPEVLGAMDVFVLSSDYEGNPLSVMEAMASGLPIVSTDAGGVSDLFENEKEGFLARPGDVQFLAQRMTSLLRNQEVRQRLGRAAMRRARECFDVSTMIRGYEELYEDLLARSHSRAPQARSDAFPLQPNIPA